MATVTDRRQARWVSVCRPAPASAKMWKVVGHRGVEREPPALEEKHGHGDGGDGLGERGEIPEGFASNLGRGGVVGKSSEGLPGEELATADDGQGRSGKDAVGDGLLDEFEGVGKTLLLAGGGVGQRGFGSRLVAGSLDECEHLLELGGAAAAEQLVHHHLGGGEDAAGRLHALQSDAPVLFAARADGVGGDVYRVSVLQGSEGGLGDADVAFDAAQQQGGALSGKLAQRGAKVIAAKAAEGGFFDGLRCWVAGRRSPERWGRGRARIER